MLERVEVHHEMTFRKHAESFRRRQAATAAKEAAAAAAAAASNGAIAVAVTVAALPVPVPVPVPEPPTEAPEADIAALKVEYERAVGQKPRGPKASDAEWLKQKIYEASQGGGATGVGSFRR